MDAAVLEWVNGPPPEDIANGTKLSEIRRLLSVIFKINTCAAVD